VNANEVRASFVRQVMPALVALALVFAALPAAASAEAAACQAQHVVQKGETLYKIGLKYNMTWDKIAKANNITRPDKIYAGQVLCIPAASGSTQPGGDVKYILALTDVNIRKGPGTSYGVIEVLAGGQTARVTGVSADGKWWRVICPDGTTGECYVTANRTLTEPATAPANGGTGRAPTISVTGVVRDQTVTVRTADFPAGEKFNVRMGKIGTQAVNGVLVTTTDSGQGGAFSVTYAIPADLRGQKQIAIRLESGSGYFSYNWFWNNSTN
jgi:uncharacterized protein YraI